MKLFVAAVLLLITTTSHAELPSAIAVTVSQALSSGKPTVIDLGGQLLPLGQTG